jgi:hypothetical protein
MKSNKPANMKMVTRVATAPNQRGDADLASDGMHNGSSQRARAQGFAGNMHSGVQDPNKTFNMGRGATVGNTNRLTAGPARPDTCTVPNYKSAMGPNDKLNFGSQVRTPGGTRRFEPAQGCNYVGNCDAINEGRGPTKGNSQ